MKKLEENNLFIVPVNCRIEDNRLIQVYNNGEEQEDFCVHGTKFRWHCDECESFLIDRDLYVEDEE